MAKRAQSPNGYLVEMMAKRINIKKTNNTQAEGPQESKLNLTF